MKLLLFLEYAPQTENCMIRYVCELLLEPGKASKRVLEWKEEARTFSISKPRVFADRWKERNGLDPSSREISSTKMESELAKIWSKYSIGSYQIISQIKPKEYVFLYGFQETE